MATNGESKNSAKTSKAARKNKKHAALDPKYNLKIRQEEIADYDYLDQLNEEELDFLNQFNAEYINADFRNSGDTPLLDTKICSDRNNARNRCVLSLSKAKGLVDSIETCNITENPEDMLITKIDLEKKKK